MPCLLVIASLCFTDVQRVEVTEPSTTSRWATATVGLGDVQILLSSDSLPGELDPRRMQRACAGTTCVMYYKWCDRGERLTCYYSLESSPYTGPWLRVSAPSQSYAEVERSLSIVTEPSNAAIPLSRLSVASPNRVPPFCRRGGRGPQCPL